MGARSPTTPCILGLNKCSLSSKYTWLINISYDTDQVWKDEDDEEEDDNEEEDDEKDDIFQKIIFPFFLFYNFFLFLDIFFIGALKIKMLAL